MTDYVTAGTVPFMTEETILTSATGGSGIVWNGNAFLINTGALDGNNTDLAEIWMTDGTVAGTVLLDTLNPTSQMFELLDVELDGNALVVAFKLNQPGVPSVFATYIRRIGL
jgi:ELWxxDGT repeat protein